MYSHKVNRYSKKLRKYHPFLQRANSECIKPVIDLQTGFLHHPNRFPIEYKRIWFAGKVECLENETGRLGLIFETQKYVKPGTTVEIAIPMRNENEKFRGKVVLIRHTGDYYEVGLWLQDRTMASRARIVEQICHIETYLLDKKHQEGPYIIDRDRVADEWISKYASSVPTL